MKSYLDSEERGEYFHHQFGIWDIMLYAIDCGGIDGNGSAIHARIFLVDEHFFYS